MKDFRDLAVWRLAHRVMLDVYHQAREFPVEERFVLTSQLKRSALSVPSNLAEGCGRFHDGDFRRFVDHAGGSCRELEYQLYAAHELNYLPDGAWHRLERDVQRVQKMLRGLHNALR